MHNSSIDYSGCSRYTKVTGKCAQCEKSVTRSAVIMSKIEEVYGRILCRTCQNSEKELKGLTHTAGEWSRNSVILYCDECGQEFSIIDSTATYRRIVYEKNLCRSCSNTGAYNPLNKTSDPDKTRMILSKKKKRFYNNEATGMQHRVTLSLIMKEAHGTLSREGDVIDSHERRRRRSFIRKLAIERDKGYCCVCHKKFTHKDLHVHHTTNIQRSIDYLTIFDELSTTRTMCLEHHKLFHKWYGTSRNTYKQYLEFKKKVQRKTGIQPLRDEQFKATHFHTKCIK